MNFALTFVTISGLVDNIHTPYKNCPNCLTLHEEGMKCAPTNFPQCIGIQLPIEVRTQVQSNQEVIT